MHIKEVLGYVMHLKYLLKGKTIILSIHDGVCTIRLSLVEQK